MILPGICTFSQPNPFETQVIVILIFKMENKNRKTRHHLVEGPATVNFKSSFCYDMISIWLDFACFFFSMSLHMYYFFGELFILYRSIAD